MEIHFKNLVIYLLNISFHFYSPLILNIFMILNTLEIAFRLDFRKFTDDIGFFIHRFFLV